MPHSDKSKFEIITLWVPKGTKHRLRVLAAKMGYIGISEYVRSVLGVDSGKCKGEAVAAQIKGDKTI